mmetsp:Transcript_88155/g.169738  ORF Transcript_88155/g.169738 Transcript_88155/m.169738 type:complete len:208 (+) Transcript_88155:591-1214(+)
MATLSRARTQVSLHDQKPRTASYVASLRWSSSNALLISTVSMASERLRIIEYASCDALSTGMPPARDAMSSPMTQTETRIGRCCTNFWTPMMATAWRSRSSHSFKDKPPCDSSSKFISSQFHGALRGKVIARSVCLRFSSCPPCIDACIAFSSSCRWAILAALASLTSAISVSGSCFFAAAVDSAATVEGKRFTIAVKLLLCDLSQA